MKKKKNIIIVIVLALVIIGGISFRFIGQNKSNSKQANQIKTNKVDKVVKTKQRDTFKNLSKTNAENVDTLDKSVSKIITEKNNKKPLDGLKQAEEALKVLDAKDDDLKSIHEAYAGVIEVVKTPDVDSLQDARTSIANMNDTDISKYMIDEYEEKLIQIVCDYKLLAKDDVMERSKPLTPQQAKAKQEKKVADAKAAEEKAKADKIQAAKEKVENDAAREAQAEADRQASQSVVAAPQGNSTQGNDAANGGQMKDGGYTSPGTGGNDGYTPPADNSGGSTSPATGSGSSSQGASDGIPTPKPGQGQSTQGDDAQHGLEMEPGGW